jgi:orotidine-5'-phosphate decarboxylase
VAGVTRAAPVPIVALDVASFEAATALVGQLGPRTDFYKIGLELYSADGPRILRWLREHDKRVFVDLKAHDIPATVRGVARSVAQLGASLFTVHVAGGEDMLRAAVEGAGPQAGAGPGCGVLGVTVLTSLDADGYGRTVGRTVVNVGDEVGRLAEVADAAGLHGVVCSGLEAAAVRDRFDGRLKTLVPGVRPAGTRTHDQARVVTPSEAATAGATYVVLGRAVTAASDPIRALEAIVSEMANEGLPQAT